MAFNWLSGMMYKYTQPVKAVRRPRTKNRISQLGRAADVTPDKPYARGDMMIVAIPLQHSQ